MADRETMVAQGQNARNLINDDTFQLAVAQARQKFTDEMLRGKSTAEREAAWHLIAALDRVETELQVIFGRGQVAQRELTRNASRT